MLQKTFPQTSNLDKSRHPQSLNQIILNVNWDWLNRFAFIFIFIDTRHQRNHFENHFKSFLSSGQFDFWSRYFQKGFFFGDFPKLLFWLIWTLLKRLRLNFSNLQTRPKSFWSFYMIPHKICYITRLRYFKYSSLFREFLMFNHLK